MRAKRRLDDEGTSQDRGPKKKPREDYIQVRMPVIDKEDRLQRFAKTLKHFTRYSGWRELSSLSYGNPSTTCSIVSSIDFDRDGEVFAVAGVTKKIKVVQL